jgi:hypothetical protein
MKAARQMVATTPTVDRTRMERRMQMKEAM